jgi:hypothetical protein
MSMQVGIKKEKIIPIVGAKRNPCKEKKIQSFPSRGARVGRPEQAGSKGGTNGGEKRIIKT